jgi:DNA repair ATPase RecN
MDFDERGFGAASAAVEMHSAALTAYQDATRRQQAALRDNDFDQIEDLAGQIDAILETIAAASRTLEPLVARLQRRAVDGPRARAVRQMLRALEADAQATATQVRELAGEMVRRRERVAAELDSVDAMLLVAGVGEAAGAGASRALNLVG